MTQQQRVANRETSEVVIKLDDLVNVSLSTRACDG